LITRTDGSRYIWVGFVTHYIIYETAGSVAVTGVLSLQYTVKKRLAIFRSPAGMSLTKKSQAGNNLIIRGQEEFGK
jgi:hypothetical protein